MRASPEEIAAMKARLAGRQETRRQEAEDAEVFSLIRRREASISTAVCWSARNDTGSARDDTGSGERAAVRRPTETAVPLYGKVTAGVVVEAVVNGVIRNWLFEMVLGLAVFAAAVL